MDKRGVVPPILAFFVSAATAVVGSLCTGTLQIDVSFCCVASWDHVELPFLRICGLRAGCWWCVYRSRGKIVQPTPAAKGPVLGAFYRRVPSDTSTRCVLGWCLGSNLVRKLTCFLVYQSHPSPIAALLQHRSSILLLVIVFGPFTL